MSKKTLKAKLKLDIREPISWHLVLLLAVLCFFDYILGLQSKDFEFWIKFLILSTSINLFTYLLEKLAEFGNWVLKITKEDEQT